MRLGAVLISIGHPRFCLPISEPTQRPRTVCERWRENLLEHYGGTPRDDQYVPQCDDLGHFRPLQCHGESDFCWCVDKDGRELPGTRSQPGTTPACKHGTVRLLCAFEGLRLGFCFLRVSRVEWKRAIGSEVTSLISQLDLSFGCPKIPSRVNVGFATSSFCCKDSSSQARVPFVCLASPGRKGTVPPRALVL